jgi:hypothetical protein
MYTYTRLEREQQLESQSVCNLRMEYRRAIGVATGCMKPEELNSGAVRSEALKSEVKVGQMIREILDREFPSPNGTNWTDITRSALKKL